MVQIESIADTLELIATIKEVAVLCRDFETSKSKFAVLKARVAQERPNDADATRKTADM